MSDPTVEPMEEGLASEPGVNPAAPGLTGLPWESRGSLDPALEKFRQLGRGACILLVLALLVTVWSLHRHRPGSRFQPLPPPAAANPGSDGKGRTAPGTNSATPPDATEAMGVCVEAISYPPSVKSIDGVIPVVCKVSRGLGIGRIPLVPLVVLLDAKAKELREKAGETSVLLEAGQQRDGITVSLSIAGIPSGTYYLAVIPTDPDSGKKIGKGVYRQPVTITDQK